MATVIEPYVIFDGLNSAPVNGDEHNGAGYNEPVWPDLFDSYEGFKPVIVDSDMFSMFDTDCPDVVIACTDNTITIPAGVSTIVIRG